MRLAIALQVATGNLGRRGGSSGAQTWAGLPGAALRGHPGAAQPCRGEHRRERLGGRGPARVEAGARRERQVDRPDTRRLQRRRQLRGPGRRRGQEHACHGGARVLGLPRALPDRDGAVLRRRAAGDALARARRRRVHERQLRALLAQGRRPAWAGDATTTTSSPTSRTLGVGDAFTEGKDEDAWLREFIEWSQIPDADEFRAAGIYFAPDQERVGLGGFADEPERYAAVDAVGQGRAARRGVRRRRAQRGPGGARPARGRRAARCASSRRSHAFACTRSSTTCRGSASATTAPVAEPGRRRRRGASPTATRSS